MLRSFRGPAGGRDQLDDDTTRFTEELYPLIPEEKEQSRLRKCILKCIIGKGVDEGEFNPNEVWPKCLGNVIQKELEQSGGSSKSLGELMREDYRLIEGDPYTRLSEEPTNDECRQILKKLKLRLREPFDSVLEEPTKGPKDDECTQLLKKLGLNKITNFREESARDVITGIVLGKTAIISRVLETDVDWLFIRLAHTLESTKSGLAKIVLSDNEMLPFIGTQESEKAKITGRKLKADRGISKNANITSLRHLCQHAGTLATVYLLQSRFDNRIEFYKNLNNPTARCNIVCESDNHSSILSCYFVSMESWDVGLDSAFYQVRDPSSWGKELMDEVFKKAKLLSNDDIRDILTKSMEMEQNILNETGWEETANKIIKTTKINGKEISYRDDGTERKFPLIQYYINLLDAKKSSDIWASIPSISEEQNILEKLMATLRRKVGHL